MRKIVFVSGLVLLILWGVVSILAQSNTCPDDYAGFLAPRLEMGGRGMVVPGGSGNRVRSEPSTTGEQVGTMSPGVQFDVISEPQCDASAELIWWQIVADDGLTGWTAEGFAPDDYFLEPIIRPEDVKTPTPTLTRTPYPTWTPSATPTAVALSGLDLPDLAVLTVDNVAQIDIVGEIPTTGRAVSLFMPPDMTHIFIISSPQQGIDYANVYTFPELQPVTQGIPVGNLFGFGASHRPYSMFTSDSQHMVVSTHLSGGMIFYTIGEPTFITDDDFSRHVNGSSLSDYGILAIASWTGTGAEPKREYDFCFIDKFNETYAPDDRLCLPPNPDSYGILRFLADGARVISGTQDGLKIYYVRSGEVLNTFNYRMVSGGTLEIMPNSQVDNSLPTVLISKEGFVLSVNLETREERTFSVGGAYVPAAIEIKPDGTQIAVLIRGAAIPEILVIDLATKSLLYQNGILDYTGQAFAYTPEGSLAYFNNNLFDTDTWESLFKFRGDQHIIALSPDGTMLFVLNTTKWTFEIYGVVN